MIEQKSVSKKEKVGSLFFHLFNRLSLWFYTLLTNSMIARLLTSYDILEQRWSDICTYVFGAPDGKLRQRLHRMRLKCAFWIEHSLISHIPDRFIKIFINCPLNVYGIFFFMYGAVGAAVYFVATRLSVDYGGNLGWGIAGIIIAFASLPLLCTGKTLYRAAFGSRIVGKMLRSYLGLERLHKGKDKNKEKERAGTLMVYSALILGVGAGALTFFVHPATIPILALLAVLAIIVLYIPESGVLLAAGTIGFWWVTGYPVLCAIAITSITLISYLFKLIRGKRVLHVRLIDFVILLLMAVFALHGVLANSGFLSTIYGVGYALLIAMYFPTTNLIRSPEWLRRCYKLLAVSGVAISVASVLPLEQIQSFMDITLQRVDLSMFSQLYAHYNAYFGQSTVVGGLLMLLLPMMLSGLTYKNTITGYFWKVFWVIVAGVAILATMQLGVWMGIFAAFLIFIFTYSYRSLSATMLMTFPIGCAVVWHRELDKLFGIRNLDIVQMSMDMIVSYADNMESRRAVARSILNMSADNLLGVGFGDHAVNRVFPLYAERGMESATDIENTFLQLIAECGYLGLAVLLTVIVLFMLCALTYLHWGGNKITKARVSAGLAGLTGVVVMGIFCNLMNNASLFSLIWLVLGLSVASLRTQYEVHARAVQTHQGNGESTDIAYRTK